MDRQSARVQCPQTLAPRVPYRWQPQGAGALEAYWSTRALGAWGPPCPIPSRSRGHFQIEKEQMRYQIWVGSVLLPATVSKQLLLFFEQGLKPNHHHPLSPGIWY